MAGTGCTRPTATAHRLPRHQEELASPRCAGIRSLSWCWDTECVFKIAGAPALYCWEQHLKSNFCFKLRISKVVLSQQSLLHPTDQG